MKYKKAPKELIRNWFKDKMNFSLSNEQLNDLCSQIDNQAKINYTRCCKSDSELLRKRPNTSSTWECFSKSDKQQKGNV